MKQTLTLCAVLALFVGSAPSRADAEPTTGEVRVPTPAPSVVDIAVRDTRQRILLESAPRARALALLFAGGSGYLKLDEDGNIKRKNNFLIRSRKLFHQRGISTVVFEATHDRRRDDRMNGGWRASREHAADIAAVVNYLKGEIDLPVWLVGTSRGTVSVANAASRPVAGIAGVVFTASLTEENGRGGYVFDFDLGKIAIPAIVAHHVEDECGKTPPSGARALYEAIPARYRKGLFMVDGGDPPITSACRALSAHGFLGREASLIEDLSRAMLARGAR